jgi:hypothetical protein
MPRNAKVSLHFRRDFWHNAFIRSAAFAPPSTENGAWLWRTSAFANFFEVPSMPVPVFQRAALRAARTDHRKSNAFLPFA